MLNMHDAVQHACGSAVVAKTAMKHLRFTEGDTGAKAIARPYNRYAHIVHVKLALHVTKLATADTLQES